MRYLFYWNIYFIAGLVFHMQQNKKNATILQHTLIMLYFILGLVSMSNEIK